MSSVYNADNELVGETYSQNGTGYGMTFQQTYDWEGRVLEQTRNAIGSSLTVTSVYAYNAENSVTSLDESTTASTIADYVLSYDQDQELTQQIDHGNTTSFAYDALGELTNYGTTVQSYTTAGNRTVDTTTYGNEVTYDGTYSYTYDGEGNEITKDGAGQTWSFTYDDDNHMIQASEVTAGSTTISDFRYDALGNMTEEDVTVSSGGSPTVTGTKYVIDAWNPAKSGAIGLSGTDVIADLRASDGSLITHYVWDDQVGGLVGRYDTSIAKDSGGLYFTMTDQQGSVRDIVDSSGGVVDTLNYDAFGNQLSTVSNYDGRYTWESYDHDAETELYFAGARVYDPESGRWMSQDPEGFSAGDSNLYRYVNNSPTNATDPSGMDYLTTESGEVRWTNYSCLRGGGRSYIKIGQKTGNDIKLSSTWTGYLGVPPGTAIDYDTLNARIKEVFPENVDGPGSVFNFSDTDAEMGSLLRSFIVSGGKINPGPQVPGAIASAGDGVVIGHDILNQALTLGMSEKYNEAGNKARADLAATPGGKAAVVITDVAAGTATVATAGAVVAAAPVTSIAVGTLAMSGCGISAPQQTRLNESKLLAETWVSNAASLLSNDALFEKAVGYYKSNQNQFMLNSLNNHRAYWRGLVQRVDAGLKNNPPTFKSGSGGTKGGAAYVDPGDRSVIRLRTSFFDNTLLTRATNIVHEYARVWCLEEIKYDYENPKAGDEIWEPEEKRNVMKRGFTPNDVDYVDVWDRVVSTLGSDFEKITAK
jgi:RHS repeat-associated protein